MSFEEDYPSLKDKRLVLNESNPYVKGLMCDMESVDGIKRTELILYTKETIEKELIDKQRVKEAIKQSIIKHPNKEIEDIVNKKILNRLCKILNIEIEELKLK